MCTPRMIGSKAFVVYARMNASKVANERKMFYNHHFPWPIMKRKGEFPAHLMLNLGFC